MGDRTDVARDLDTVELLKHRLAEASTAACTAYQDNVRLIRVLTVLGQPLPPTALTAQTLTTLAQVFDADVTAIVQLVGGRLIVTEACGLPEDDTAFSIGWSVGESAARVLAGGEALARYADGASELADVPRSLAGCGIRSAAWIPLWSGSKSGDEMLVMYRRSDSGLNEAELQVLGTVAFRLGLALEASGRTLLAERLAQSGHRLTQHLELPSLLAEAARLMRDILAADSTWVVTVEQRVASLRAHEGSAVLSAWPRPADQLPGWDALAAGQPRREGVCEGCGIGPDGAHAVLCVPVMRNGTPAVLLFAVRNKPRPFLDDEVETATIFANYLRAAMINTELYRALRESEESQRLITDSISDLIAVLDADGRFAYASPSYGRELAHPPDHLFGNDISALVHPNDLQRLRAALEDPARAPKVEYRLNTGSGTWVWVESALRPAPSADGKVVLSSRIIEERKRLEDELRRRATHDPLTRLANRALTGQRLEDALSSDEPTRVGLLFCDLDKFKAINDRLGHEAGDELLQLVAERLRGCLRRDDLLARLGGDEFVFVLDGVTDLEEVARVGHRVRKALDTPFDLRGERLHISASIGGVCGIRGNTTASAMLRDADAAMYTAKGKGAGLVEVFDEAASYRSLERLSIRSDLLTALDRNELVVHYQPIVDLPSGSIAGFESLLRWRHPRRGLIPPDMFIPLAEETGAIHRIGAWVLGQACRQLAVWHGSCSRGLSISVNMSPTQLQRPDIAAETLAVVRHAAVDPGDVWLEVTEHAAVSIDVGDPVRRLRLAGLHFSLDDFGISYSNLNHLRRFPVDGLKIDKSFVAGLTAGEQDKRINLGIVRAILAIADSLDLTVIAEGIETLEQRDLLLNLGCRRGQGFLLSRPVSAEDATALLRSAHHPPRPCGTPPGGHRPEWESEVV